MTEAQDEARRLMERHARSFYRPAMLLPRASRGAVVELYAICRVVDDLSDLDGSPAALGRLDALRAAVEAGDGSDPLAARFEAILGHSGPARAAMVALIDGVRGDGPGVAMADDAALLAYCHAVAGTVGLMMAAILGARDPAALRHAADLGIAMQLTNIARDVMEDAHAGRRYLPATDLPLTPAGIATCDDREAAIVARATLRALDLAEGRYASGRDGLRFLDRRSALVIAAAAGLYRAIGVRVRRRGGDPRLGRAVVPTAAKVGAALRAVLAVPRRRVATGLIGLRNGP